jgi:hypothetical protein
MARNESTLYLLRLSGSFRFDESRVDIVQFATVCFCLTVHGGYGFLSVGVSLTALRSRWLREGLMRCRNLWVGTAFWGILLTGCSRKNEGPTLDSWMAPERWDSQPASDARARVDILVDGLADARSDAMSCSVDSWCIQATFSGNCLYNLWGSGPSDIFATAGGGMLFHYDGSTWSTMSAAPYGTNYNDIWGSGPTDVYVVSRDYNPPSGGCTTYPTAIHYDGTSWQRITSLTGCPCTKSFDGYFNSVWGTGPSDVYIAGSCGGALLYHFDGTSWGKLSFPWIWFLFGSIWGSGPTDIWAVYYGDIVHYDGTGWNETGSKWFVNAIWGSSSSDIYTVGDYQISSGHYDNVILHYDGTAWSTVYLGSTGSGGLSGVWGSSASDVYAVGWYGEILHYDGKSWSAQASGIKDLSLSDVWGSGPHDVYAVGCTNGTNPMGVILHRTQ